MPLDPSVTPFSLPQIRAKQSEFIEVLERQVKRGGDTAVDLFAIANEVDIVPILAVEFVYHWIGMGRLHKSWGEIAKKMQEDLTKGPLKPPTGMIPIEGAAKRRTKKSPDKDQRRVYDELWRDIVAIQETRNTSQIPFANREEGERFHRSQMQRGFDGIAKVDRLSPYLDNEHYQVVRNYINVFCNYHSYRLEKYADKDVQNPSGWDEQDALLYGQIFGRGQLEIAQVFRDILAGQDVEEASNVSIGRFHMGDTYTAGQAGAMGPGATASNMTLQQVWNQMQASVTVEELAKELSVLRTAMRSEASEPEHEISIGAVAAAEAAAKAGDGPKTLEYLKKAGTWAFDVATKIGVNIASSVLKGTLGLP